MVSFKINSTINKPLNVVVMALMDPKNFIYWTTDLKKFEVIKGKPGEIGSISHLHYEQKGKSYIMEDRLIYCEPGKKYISQVSGEAIIATVETILFEYDEKTDISIHWKGKGKNILLKILLPLFKGKMIKQSIYELGIFKILVEERGHDFSSPV